MSRLFSVPKTTDSIFFWSVVQHLRDFISFGGRPHQKFKKSYIITYEWIVDGVALQWGDSDLVMTFSEALEILGVAPENISIIRDGLIESVNKPRKVRSEICKRLYADLCWQNDEPEPLWVHANVRIPRSIHMDEV